MGRGTLCCDVLQYNWPWLVSMRTKVDVWGWLSCNYSLSVCHWGFYLFFGLFTSILNIFTCLRCATMVFFSQKNHLLISQNLCIITTPILGSPSKLGTMHSSANMCKITIPVDVASQQQRINQMLYSNGIFIWNKCNIYNIFTFVTFAIYTF